VSLRVAQHGTETVISSTTPESAEIPQGVAIFRRRIPQNLAQIERRSQ